ncbi:hypothetical protein EC973_002412 [Apophysomyces ossiformis]|uniref:Pentatricopeptide repeat-containing protein-mitochondrial domain-containing protein n=1 Tax=Apophysomyces ossiformis TaxID=679940 RepID=A0A8H7BKN1_9FUNG|nr:hypothetical protein EC973_002412 [Apophysomyces ossiformis]
MQRVPIVRLQRSTLTNAVHRKLVNSHGAVLARSNYTSAAAPTTGSEKTNFITFSHPINPLATFNQRLAQKLRQRGGNAKRILDDVKDIVKDIESKGLKFDINTYNGVISAYAKVRDYNALLKTMDKMEKDGIKPSLDTYNIIAESVAQRGEFRMMRRVIESMEKNNVEPSASTYQQILRCLCNNDQLEQAIETLELMKEKNLGPNIASYGTVISCCLKLSDATTAYKLLKEAEDANLLVESQPNIYMDVMRAAALNDQYKATEYCWNATVEKYNIRPDEGACLEVLRVAAKEGDTKLVTDVIRKLSTSGYPYKEHYFTPLMEAFLSKNDLKSAFNVLDIMRVSGIALDMRSTLPIQEKLSKNMKAIDKAYFLLEELKREGKAVDITAFNVVVKACAQAGDVHRTVATYREAANLGVKPDVDTYNAVLEVCVETAMQGMGDVVIQEMKKADVAPNVETYSRMIALACTQKNYENAFTYLEEMKSYGVIPPETTYAILLKKLAEERDPRFHLALEEVETFGYNVSPKLRGLWRRK